MVLVKCFTAHLVHTPMRDLPTVCLARKGHSTVENFNHSASLVLGATTATKVKHNIDRLDIFADPGTAVIKEYKGCAQLARFNHIRDRLHVIHVLKDLTALGKDKQVLLEHADQGGTVANNQPIHNQLLADQDTFALTVQLHIK
ncbi:uncharacterized protein LOC128226684 [Mya arenaria]|uniref:uncharacterized protein LOC128226684 n=1 Tax=Mya arenaria TaxID=6604 RepID=UPI0022E3376F|nr:uncharacterized protein LOC128226684 [Mya arenaria]